MRTLRRVKREPKTTVPLSDELVETWLELKDVKKKIGQEERELKKEIEKIEEQMITALGTAEAGVTECHGVVTFYESTRKGYTVAAKTSRKLGHERS